MKHYFRQVLPLLFFWKLLYLLLIEGALVGWLIYLVLNYLLKDNRLDNSSAFWVGDRCLNFTPEDHVVVLADIALLENGLSRFTELVLDALSDLQ